MNSPATATSRKASSSNTDCLRSGSSGIVACQSGVEAKESKKLRVATASRGMTNEEESKAYIRNGREGRHTGSQERVWTPGPDDNYHNLYIYGVHYSDDSRRRRRGPFVLYFVNPNVIDVCFC